MSGGPGEGGPDSRSMGAGPGENDGSASQRDHESLAESSRGHLGVHQ
jgi:hypothetical protein